MTPSVAEGPAHEDAIAAFSGYVFVRLALRDRLMVLQFRRRPAHFFQWQAGTLPDKEIEALRTGWRRSSAPNTSLLNDRTPG